LPIRLMCLTAHPDDEAGAFGGALLMAAERGFETAVLCLTEGSAGSYRTPGQTNEQLAALRREEFASACTALQVSEATLLQYPDGELWQQPFLLLVGVLVEAIRRFRPHIVLTFGGEGGVNQHRDHTMVSLAATAAFHWAGRSGFFPEQLVEVALWAPQKLYYAGTLFLSNADDEARRAGTRTPSSLVYMLGPLKERKLAAFRLHTSQQGVMDRVESQYSDLLEQETYLLAAAREPNADEKDLWDGVNADDEQSASET
jgi:LmbE family N-acetylglucosaminyl deacetylase